MQIFWQKDSYSPFCILASRGDEDILAIHTCSSPNVTHQGPLARSRAKKLREQVNSFLSIYNFHTSENVILPKCSTLVVLRNIFEKKKEREKYRAWRFGHPKLMPWMFGHKKEAVITLNSVKLWRPTRTFWKALQVHFPMPQFPLIWTSQLRVMFGLVKTAQKVNSLSW